MLGDEDRLETAVAIARQIDPERPVIGDERRATCAGALVGLAFGFRLPLRVAQMQIHFGAHRALNDRLVERQHQILNLSRRHRTLHQFVQQTFRQGRQRPEGRCLRSDRAFLRQRHIHDLYLS